MAQGRSLVIVAANGHRDCASLPHGSIPKYKILTRLTSFNNWRQVANDIMAKVCARLIVQSRALRGGWVRWEVDVRMV